MKKVTYSMIGGGLMAKLHSLAINSYPIYFYPPQIEIEKLCICDSNEKVAKDARVHYGFKEYETDYHKLLSRTDVDVVDIATPNKFHKDMVLEAIAKGKHVYCEKPLGMNAAEALEMCQAAEKAGVVNAVGFNHRCIPGVQMIKRLIDRGALGNILNIQMRYLQDWGITPGTPMQWRFNKELSGTGALGDIGSHALDIGRFFAGAEYKSAFAQWRTVVQERNVAADGALLNTKVSNSDSLEKAKVDVDDETLSILTFANGITATMQASRLATGHKDTLDVEVYGTKGAARFSRERPNEVQFYSMDDGDTQGYKSIKMGPEHPYGNFWAIADEGIGYTEQKCAEMSHFFEALAKNDSSLVSSDFRNGYKICQVVDALCQSAKTGKLITIQE